MWDSSWPINFLKMVLESTSLEKIPSMEVSNFLVYPISTEPVDPYLLRIPKLPMSSQAGDTVVPSIRTGEFIRGELKETVQSPGVVLSLHVLLTWTGVQRTRTLLRAVSVMNSFVVGIASAWGVPPQVATLSGIWGSIVVVMIKRFRLINNFCWKFTETNNGDLQQKLLSNRTLPIIPTNIDP